MSPSDLDLPLMPSAEQIRRKEFATIRRGYDPDQVRDYLRAVAAQLETLEKDVRETKLAAASKANLSPGEALAAQVAKEQAEDRPEEAVADPYERLAARFEEMIRRADEEATNVVEEAREESTRILQEARTEADRIRVDAQARAEEARQAGSEALAKAKEEADRTLGTLAERRETLVVQMQEMQSRLLSVAQDLEGALTARDAAIEETLEQTEPEPPPESEATSSTRGSGGDEEILDPRYEDLWVSREKAVDIPDLAPLDIDFDDDQGD
ncbi:MAG TPA: DivIVA domain-containing protein [Actinomycetota bacterium]